MDDLVQKTLDKIKKEHIKPKPEWQFSLSKILSWVLFAVIAVLGAVSLAAIFGFFAEADWDIFPRLHFGFFRILYFMFPPLWLIFLAVSLVLAYIVFRSTKYGYRYGAGKICATIILVVVVLGILSFVFKIERLARQGVAMMMPRYMAMMDAKTRIWSQPGDGLLGGEVVSNDAEKKIIILRDPANNSWKIFYEKAATFPKRIICLSGCRIKVIGEQLGNLQFRAFEIRPWEGIRERSDNLDDGRTMMPRWMMNWR